jgi:FkbM family methyltransferase
MRWGHDHVVVAVLRRLRHGPLKRFDAFWLLLGRCWRWLFRRLGGAVSLSHKIGPYGPFRLDGFFAFSNFAQWGNRHNEGFAACVEACRGRRCVLDVGAHIGLVTLPMASVLSPAGRIVSFEPGAVNRGYLERHVALNNFNSVVTIENKLVGAQDGARVAFFELDDAAGQNTTIEGVLPAGVRRSIVAQVSLDCYCERTGLSPEVIKIDVEGAEIDVLRGARNTLKTSRPVVFLSVHPRQIQTAGRSLDELDAVIAEVGYESRHIDGSAVSTYALREYVLRPVTAASSAHKQTMPDPEY